VTESIPFDRSFCGAPGEFVGLSRLVRRMIAPNPGPMTFTGTCTYAVGQGEVALIDPGPANKDYIAALLHALSTEAITAILVTHTHIDHSPAARALKTATGAKIFGCPPPPIPSSPA
jgi:glyoxylase-like metal-dependent hydrolase (beta-lactamase superfamily II)